MVSDVDSSFAGMNFWLLMKSFVEKDLCEETNHIVRLVNERIAENGTCDVVVAHKCSNEGWYFVPRLAEIMNAYDDEEEIVRITCDKFVDSRDISARLADELMRCNELGFDSIYPWELNSIVK